VGGPFSPSSQSFALVNAGIGTLTWQAASTVPWLTVSPASGTLGATPANVTVSLNSVSSNLSSGSYVGGVLFTNSTTGFVQGRRFLLVIAQGSYGASVLALAPVAYWQLNETNPVPPADVAANVGS